MKAIVMRQTGAPEVLGLEEIPTPVPGPGQVLIQVKAVGVNYGETAQRRGTYPLPLALPATPGNELAGTVAACGSGVATPQPGDRVAVLLAAPGAYAEYVVADANTAVPLPPDITFAQAVSLLAQGLTAYFLVHQAARVQAGQRVLVPAAAGGVGSLAVQLAHLLGAEVVAAASSPAKRAATQGHGVDVVLESVGGSIGRQCLELLAPFGRLVLYGNLSDAPMQLDGNQLGQLIFLNQSVTGFSIYGLTPEQVRGALAELFDHVRHGRVQLIGQHRYPLAEAAAAHRAIEERRTTGKVILEV